MRIVSADEHSEWLNHGRVLEKDSRGPKVLWLKDGSILKIFHSRRRPWVNWLSPPAQRFARHARLLETLDIAVPRIEEVFWLDRRAGLSGCRYQPLPGTSLEHLLKQDPSTIQTLLPELAAFIEHLHETGVYFRSLHLGNILHLPQGGFGLIDFLDLKKQRHPLSQRARQRNFRHFQRYLERRRLQHFPFQALLQCSTQTQRQ